MPSGGHARSGPLPDPKSGRSERRGIQVNALPSEGYAGEAPDFPLPDCTYNEKSLWLWAWKQPQAAAWAKEPWRWPNVALWVRTFVKCSSEEAKAADINSLHRLADEIGMTTTGLRLNGWKIVTDEVAAKRSTPAPIEQDDPDDVRGRLTVVRDAAG